MLLARVKSKLRVTDSWQIGLRGILEVTSSILRPQTAAALPLCHLAARFQIIPEAFLWLCA